MNEGISIGDTVRPKWGQRSGRWLVLEVDHEFWEGAIRLRCLVAPVIRRKRRTWWKPGSEGWVKFMLERVDASTQLEHK